MKTPRFVRPGDCEGWRQSRLNSMPKSQLAMQVRTINGKMFTPVLLRIRRSTHIVLKSALQVLLEKLGRTSTK